MNENLNTNIQGAVFEVGRSVGGSRNGQIFVAVAVAVLFSCLAYGAAHARDLAATVLTFGLLVYGFQLAWRLLPISSTTRARWVRESQIAERCPAWQYRHMLWGSIGVAISVYWNSDSAMPIDYFDFVVPAIGIIIGAFSYFLGRRFIRNERNA